MRSENRELRMRLIRVWKLVRERERKREREREREREIYIVRVFL